MTETPIIHTARTGVRSAPALLIFLPPAAILFLYIGGGTKGIVSALFLLVSVSAAWYLREYILLRVIERIYSEQITHIVHITENMAGHLHDSHALQAQVAELKEYVGQLEAARRAVHPFGGQPGRPRGSLSSSSLPAGTTVDMLLPFMAKARSARTKKDGSFARLCKAAGFPERTVRHWLTEYADLIEKHLREHPEDGK